VRKEQHERIREETILEIAQTREYSFTSPDRQKKYLNPQTYGL
jgi:hypothetical protein